ncbi:MAG: endonuclease MutS2 [Myxococcales bacterium]|nr:endonuclease MutS2 [Myxococcota bacterium]MDW8282353.1 endonuclease MutS2 [Myxococcales bacterium]
MSVVISDKTRADLGWDVLLGHLADRCHTLRGKALAQQLSLLPTAEDAHARQAEIAEARGLADRGEGLPLGGVSDVSPSLERACKGGVLSPQELCDIGRTLEAGARLRRHLLCRGECVPRLMGRALLLTELRELATAIADALDESAELRDTASPALRALRQKVQALGAELSRRAESLLSEGHIEPHLQDRFVTQREGRYVLPVRADARTRVRGIVHGVSASGATVFVEPEEIIDLNNRLRLAQLEMADEERRILAELSRSVSEAAPRIRQNLEILTTLDLIAAAAQLSSDLRAVPVTLLPTGTGSIDLRNIRHPLLHLAGVQVVPSDLVCPAGGALVITGPNAGGKTVALKAVGLCVLMARAGLHCPVQEGSSLPLFEEVLTDIGDDQSLERSLSTFSAHVLNVRAFLERAGPGTLVLLDEVLSGTDPEQGAALAQAVLERLVALSATVVVTTHHDRLKALAATQPRFHNASVGYDMERLEPTYRLHLGVPGSSGALRVARRLGLPEEVVARAEALLGARQSDLEALLQLLSQERELLTAERQAAAEARRSAQVREQEAAQLLQEARAELRRARRAAHDEAVVALRRARQELEEAQRAVRLAREQPGRVEALQEARQQIDRLAREVATRAPEPDAPAGRAATAQDLVPGAEVLVPRMGARGTVLTEPVRGKVVVQVGALRLSVEAAELRIPEGTVRPRGTASPTPAPAPRPPYVRTAETTLDLRGERVEAALALAEKFLDDALRQGLPAIYLLHGHGTGALRAALREHFRNHPAVAALRPASQSEGGDGVTILELA